MALALAGWAAPASAQTYTWNTTTGNWDIATPNWIGAGSTWVNGAGNTAEFTGTTGGTVALTEAITAGSLAFTGTTAAFTISGTPSLSLESGITVSNTNTVAQSIVVPIILTNTNVWINNGTGLLTIGGGVSGAFGITVNGSGNTTIGGNLTTTAGGLTKDGTSTLTLSGTNTYSGQTIVVAGTLVTSNASALGAGGAGNETIVQSGATLNINGIALTTTEIIQIAGTGVGGNGALVNNGVAQQNALNRVVLTADASIGGSARFDIRVGTTPTLELAGYTLTKVGVNQFSLVGTAITNGNVVVNGGAFSVETTSVLQGTGTVTVNTGGALLFYQTTGTNITRDIVGNGGTIGNTGVSAAVNSNILLATGTTTTFGFTAGVTNTFAGIISGSGNVAKATGEIVVFSGPNTYSGTTTINAGRLILSNTNTTPITVNNGGMFGSVGSGSTTQSLTTNAGSTIALAGGLVTTGFTANSLAINGTTTITFDTLPAPGTTYTVANYGAGGLSGSTASLTSTSHFATVNTGTAIQLVYQGPTTNTWNTTDGNWDLATLNWTNPIGDSKFVNGDAALFNTPAAASTVTIPTGVTVLPRTVTFDNSSAFAYTIAGAGSIGGSASLIKNGTGTVNISTQQTYTGNTIINGGVLSLTGGGGGAGTIRGTVTVNAGGTLQLAANDVTGFSGGATAITVINLLGGTLNVTNTTSNQTLGSTVINMTAAGITGLAGTNLDFFGGASTLNTLPSSTTSTISGVFLSPLRQGSTTFNISSGTTASGIDLDISSVLRTSNSGNGANALLIKSGAGNMRLTAQNTLSGTTNGYNVAGGTLTLGFGTVTTNILATGASLTLSGGRLNITNASAGAITQTVNGLTTSASTGSQILLASNSTLTLGALTAAGAASALNFNTAAGGADAATPNVGTSIVVLTGQLAGNPVNSGFTVTDSTGFDLATVNASNQVVRLTGSALLPAAGAASPTNYRIDNNASGGDGSSTLTASVSQSANSITVDTTTAAGTLTLATGVTLNNNTWNFGGTGTNAYTITGGTGITSVASGGTISFNNSNAGTLTISSPIIANGTNPVNFTGTGTTILGVANTYIGATIINSGTVRLSNVTSLGTTAAGTTVNTGATLDLNGIALGAEAFILGGRLVNSSATLASLSGTVNLPANTNTFLGSNSGNILLSNVVSGAGVLSKTGTNTVILSTAANTYTGGTLVNSGRLQVGNNGSENAAALGTGLVTVNSGATLAFLPGSSATTFSFTNSFSVNGGTILGEDGVQRLATGAGATFAIGTLGATVQATWNGKDVYIDGLLSGTGALTVSHGPTGGQSAPAVRITNGSNTYSGTVTVGGGLGILLSLEAANALQYATVGTLATGTVRLNTPNTAYTVAGLAGTAGTIVPNATAGTYTLIVNAASDSSYGGTLANNTGLLALTKYGPARLTLTGNNTYTAGTVVSAGTLLAIGQTSPQSATGTNTVTVNGGIAAGTLGGNGRVAGAVVVNGTGAIPGTITAGTATGATMLTLGSTLTLGDGARYRTAIFSPLAGDASLLSAAGNVALGTTTGAFITLDLSNVTPATLSAQYPTGTTYTIVSTAGTVTAPNLTIDYANSTMNGFNNTDFSLTINSNTVVLNYNPVPEPGTIGLLATLGLGAGYLRRRWAKK